MSVSGREVVKGAAAPMLSKFWGFRLQDWDLGLKACFWASRVGFGLQGQKAGI